MSTQVTEYTAPVGNDEQFVIKASPDLVECSLTDFDGGLSWLFGISPNQARIIAAALQLAANDADQARPVLDVIGPN